MLIHETDVDKHLDFLEKQDGETFFLSAQQIARNDTRRFEKKVLEHIKNASETHSLIIVEQPPHRWGRFTRRFLKNLGRKVEKKRIHHNIHAFTVPSEFFTILLNNSNAHLN